MSDPAERKATERLCLTLIETCVRNTGLENLHAGRFPVSAAGDFSDVKVVTPDGEIPWTALSRISDAEMKTLMIEMTDRLFTYLTYPDALTELRASTQNWDRPKLDVKLMNRVRRLQAEGVIAAPDKDAPESKA